MDDSYEQTLKKFNIDINKYLPKKKRITTGNDSRVLSNNELYDKYLKERGLEPVKTGPRIPDETGVMNAGLQKYNLQRKLKRELGDGADFVDAGALIDRDCHYDENLSMILPKLGIDNSGKTPEEKAADDEEQALDFYCEQIGRDKQEVLQEQKKKEDQSKYSSICVLADVSWHDFKASGKLTSIRITKIFEKSTVDLLMNFMLNTLKESGYRDWLISQYGHNCVVRDFEANNLFRGLKLVGCAKTHFRDPRREYNQPFDLRANLPRGNDDLILFYSKKQQETLEEFCKQFKDVYNIKIKKTDVGNLYLINSIESYFSVVKYTRIPDPDKKVYIKDFENSHYYINRNELVTNVQNLLAIYREHFVTHFKGILPIMEIELEIKKHEPGVTPANLEYKQRTIQEIRKFIDPIEF